MKDNIHELEKRGIENLQTGRQRGKKECTGGKKDKRNTGHNKKGLMCIIRVPERKIIK